MSPKHLSDWFQEIDQVVEQFIKDLDRLVSVSSRMGSNRTAANDLLDIVYRTKEHLLALREFTGSEEGSDKAGKKQAARTE